MIKPICSNTMLDKDLSAMSILKIVTELYDVSVE
jgi:hypothetical protein